VAPLPERVLDQVLLVAAVAGWHHFLADGHLGIEGTTCTVICTGGFMKTFSYTESRARYAEVLDAVVNDHEEAVITRAGHESVVIVSLADYESLRETAYLMRSPVNARRLLDAMERLETGGGVERELVEAD
jgi:antitoxin YefM